MSSTLAPLPELGCETAVEQSMPTASACGFLLWRAGNRTIEPPAPSPVATGHLPPEASMRRDQREHELERMTVADTETFLAIYRKATGMPDNSTVPLGLPSNG